MDENEIDQLLARAEEFLQKKPTQPLDPIFQPRSKIDGRDQGVDTVAREPFDIVAELVSCIRGLRAK